MKCFYTLNVLTDITLPRVGACPRLGYEEGGDEPRHYGYTSFKLNQKQLLLTNLNRLYKIHFIKI